MQFHNNDNLSIPAGAEGEGWGRQVARVESLGTAVCIIEVQSKDEIKCCLATKLFLALGLLKNQTQTFFKRHPY